MTLSLPAHRACSVVVLGAAALTLSACVGPSFAPLRPGGLAGLGAGARARQIQVVGMPDMTAMRQQQQLTNDLMSSPDLPAWHDERQKQTMAIGDREFDKSFEEVFDGMVIALATLGSRVTNMDRTSGYITGSIPDLGPERQQQLQTEALAEYAKMKGYPDSVLQKTGYGMDPTTSQNMWARMGGSGLTLTMVHQSAHRTKVKLRFDNVYFPKTAHEMYRNVWATVDKQMFLDKALDH
jgi:hypothetical protein